MKNPIIKPLLLGLALGAAQIVRAHWQFETNEGGHKLRFTAFDDARNAPYRIYFWDESLTGSSFRFDDMGSLVYFKAGSSIHHDAVRNEHGTIEFSVKHESDAGKTTAPAIPEDHRDESATCPQCSEALYHVCDYGLPAFCQDVAPLDADEGRRSVKILCDNYAAACAAAITDCDSTCASGESFSST